MLYNAYNVYILKVFKSLTVSAPKLLTSSPGKPNKKQHPFASPASSSSSSSSASSSASAQLSDRKRGRDGTMTTSSPPMSPHVIDMEDIAGGREGGREGDPIPIIHSRRKSVTFIDESEEAPESSSSSSSSSTPLTQSRVISSSPTPPPTPTAPPLFPSSDPVTITKNMFSHWLGVRKSGWREARKERRFNLGLLTRSNSRSLSFPQQSSNDMNVRKKAIGVRDMVRNASLEAASRCWQVIELQASDTPGEYVVWAMTSKTQLQRLKVM